MSKSNSHNKPNTLSMVPENGKAEIHHPQRSDNTEQDKAVEGALQGITEHKKGGMGQLPATAICGNDIASSCLYVSALAIIYAGRWAPLALLIVAGVLYLFRSIYAEVVGALPLNGGAYNALLNTTSKFKASIAACLTILSYMATAVISASEAMHYVHTIWHSLPVTSATIGVLAFFHATDHHRYQRKCQGSNYHFYIPSEHVDIANSYGYRFRRHARARHLQPESCHPCGRRIGYGPVFWLFCFFAGDFRV